MAMTTRRNILIVEDEEALSRMMQWQLAAAGYDVHGATHGHQALAYAAEHRPDLVILDLRLPDMDGYDVCRQLRKLYQPWTAPILMLTAMDKPMDQLRGFAYGADAYMTKPYEETDLLRTIALLFGEVITT